MKKNFYIENLGCAKNQVDAEIMITALVDHGWELAGAPEQAGVIIINTCGFIAAAREQSIDISLEYRARYPGKRIIMAGCLTERYGAELEGRMPEINAFTGNKNPAGIIRLLEDKAEDTLLHNESLVHRRRLLSLPGSAYMKIAEGCNNRCAYCSIPLIRGSLRSRRVEEVTAEIAFLAEQGIFEFNLVAQDLGSFGKDRTGEDDLPALFRAIAALDIDFWMRPLYIHPEHFPAGILEIMAADNRFLPYFDLPFQHASAALLAKMGRRGTAGQYLDLVDLIRSRIPGAVIRSTFLVGFPGEGEEDFNTLLEFQKKAAITWLGIFTYSREEGTPAYTLPGRVPVKTAQARKILLEQRQAAITELQLERFVGREMRVLIEEAVTGEELFLGRSYAQAPEVDGLVVVNAAGLQPGKTVPVKIIRRNGIDLEGVAV